MRASECSTRSGFVIHHAEEQWLRTGQNNNKKQNKREERKKSAAVESLDFGASLRNRNETRLSIVSIASGAPPPQFVPRTKFEG